MLRLTDAAEVRGLLETARPWSVYALGDLAPHRFPHCTWLRGISAEPHLVLLYREFGTPVLFTLGRAETLRPLLDEAAEPKMLLHVRPEVVELLRPRYRIEHEADMWRMILDPTRFPAQHTDGAAPLTAADVPALRRLYADGEPAGEAPEFFFPQMVDEGFFFGIRDQDELIAAGGTHLVVLAEGVAAVGNIYTRRDRRGRGLATRVTATVTAALLRQRVRTTALNVNQRNTAAIKVYERLGYARYCAFKEGVALEMTKCE